MAPSLTYAWNARNQLASMTGDFGGAYSETYDILGRRESSTLPTQYGGETLSLLHDGSGVIASSGSLGESWSFLTVPGGGALAGTYSNPAGTTYVPLVDAEGSTIALVNTAQPGSVFSTFTYDPYGWPTVAGTRTSWPFQWHGLEMESTDPVYFDSTGNAYNPAIQRFLSEVGQEGLGGPGSGPAGESVEVGGSGGGGSLSVFSARRSGYASGGAAAGFLIGSLIGTEAGSSFGPEGAAVGAALGAIAGFFEDLFGGGGSTELPRQLKYGRHIIYPWQGFSRSRIVTMASAGRGSIVRVQDPEYRKPLQKPQKSQSRESIYAECMAEVHTTSAGIAALGICASGLVACRNAPEPRIKALSCAAAALGCVGYAAAHVYCTAKSLGYEGPAPEAPKYPKEKTPEVEPPQENGLP